MGLRVVSLVALMLVVADKNVYGKSESVLNKIIRLSVHSLMECAEEMDITKEMVQEIMKKMEDHPCLVACTARKNGIMDDAGMYSLEGAQKLIKEIMEGENPEEAKELDDVALKCVSVNDEQVKDGAKGCERAILIYKCFKGSMSHWWLYITQYKPTLSSLDYLLFK